MALDTKPNAAEQIRDDLTAIRGTLDDTVKKQETSFRDMKTALEGEKASNAETRALAEKLSKDYSDTTTAVQALSAGVDALKKQLDAPANAGGSDLKEHDRSAAIELQRRAHVHKHGDDDKFKLDNDNLVNVADLRSAVRKWMKVGIETKAKIRASLTPAEVRAFEAASLDSGFFSPEILGYVQDCNILAANLLDLYAQWNVSRSQYRYLAVKDYGAIGKYDCDAKCDAEMGPEGNMAWLEGKTYDYRGVFCLTKKVLQEANVDLLAFLMGAAQRSYFINRNRVTVTGDGINEPLGWQTADVFPKFLSQSAGVVNHVDWRTFMSTFRIERGVPTAIMHQNVFGYLAAQVDASGRFIFGDGLMGFSPDNVTDRIRISNWLPDPTANRTVGNAATPFPANSFFAAIGAWKDAYSVVNKRPMWMEQWEGGSSAWCVKYQFGAEDGAQVLCSEAAQILLVQ
jgi:HK97 family phage major capsid protein